MPFSELFSSNAGTKEGMDSLGSVYGNLGMEARRQTVSSPSDRESHTPTSLGSPESELFVKRKKSKSIRNRVQEFQRWVSGSTNGSRSSRASTLSATSSAFSSGSKDLAKESATLDRNMGRSWSPPLNSGQTSTSTLRPFMVQSAVSPPSYIRTHSPSSGGESDMEVELPPDAALNHPMTPRAALPSTEQSATPTELSEQPELPELSEQPCSQICTTVNTNFTNVGKGMLAMDAHHSSNRAALHERNVEEFMDARSGSEDLVNGNEFTDAEGVKVRNVKLLPSQNVGFESLPVQFVNKATKAGFIFNILVIGETGIGKSTLINSLFNYDFKLPPGDYRHDTVTLDKHAFQLEEGSVRLHLTIIETKGYGDQLNMADSCQGIVEYIDKQYEAYFQEESQVVRRLSDYKDTRIHVCLFLLAPTGSNVRALDLECMKLLSNKVNIIPVIARGDSLTKKELDSFKRRITDEIRQHKISIYSFPEDDGQVADLNRKMNADVPFAVVGSSEVHEVAGHKARARIYPWGIVDIENEAHCDFTRFREALLRVNMDHLMQTTNLRHYEVYRDRRMTELGYGENEPQNFMETITRLRQTNEQKYRQKEEETRTSFVNKVREKESELKERERELHSQFEHRKSEFTDRVQEIQMQQSALQKEVEIFHRVKSELVNSQAGTIKGSKKK